jgi:hypothetical protein
MNAPANLLTMLVWGVATTLSAASDPFQPRHKLTARTYNSGFADAHDTYNGMGCGRADLVPVKPR